MPNIPFDSPICDFPIIDMNVSGQISHTWDSQDSDCDNNHLDQNSNDLNNYSTAHSQVLGIVHTYREVCSTEHTQMTASTKHRIEK